MQLLLSLLIVFIILEHIGFLILEMFLWNKPLGLKVFKLTPQKAEATKILASNQGLYNGFLAIGLLLAFVLENHIFITFFLLCIVTAGIYGAYSVSKSILYVQALPAAAALAVLYIL